MGSELKIPTPSLLLFPLSTPWWDTVFSRSLSCFLLSSELLSNTTARSAVQCMCTHWTTPKAMESQKVWVGRDLDWSPTPTPRQWHLNPSLALLFGHSRQELSLAVLNVSHTHTGLCHTNRRGPGPSPQLCTLGCVIQCPEMLWDWSVLQAEPLTFKLDRSG